MLLIYLTFVIVLSIYYCDNQIRFKKVVESIKPDVGVKKSG